MPLALQYARLLCTDGVERGLLGPREGARVWERHLLNSATLADLVPHDSHVVDLGSGAGLPGLPLAIARPDLRVTLVEPMLRRSTFLDECVAALGLSGVEVRRARAEELVGRVTADVVTARAVARLATLLPWSIPLVRPGGRVLALKGATVVDELTELEATDRGNGRYAPPRWLVDAGVDGLDVHEVGYGIIDPPAIVVRVTRSG
ncbi:MAG: 16S rRNA (guanine(527)-N(7))-methyltransferase RsmG [Streptosporangiales bacterium]|nr:16S rRNA (guanine(527)-N(7))-methyltransferase RsmG [Streptosporangiales bacterium]